VSLYQYEISMLHFLTSILMTFHPFLLVACLVNIGLHV